MTGTSVDGLDLALLEVRDGCAPALVAAATAPLPEPLADALRSLAQPGRDEIERLGRADAALGAFIGQTVRASLADWSVSPSAVRAIGAHGQTIRHRPQGAARERFTIQIGDANRIVEITGIDTVADFRRRDMAAGGEGAPLAPAFHETLFRSPDRHRYIVNIGGIANVTVLPAGAGDARGFDTGPGNALLDAWIARHRGATMDAEGAWAASGQVSARLLAALLRDPFLARPPPKSTGKEIYNLNYAVAACSGLDLRPEDVQATLAEFTAASVVDAIERWGVGFGDVVLCGGGRRNADLVDRLAKRLPGHRLTATDDLGFDGDALEAAAFAWLAHRALAGLPGNAPPITGASGPRILGAIYRAGVNSTAPERRIP